MGDLDAWADCLAAKLEPLVHDYRVVRSLVDGTAKGEGVDEIDPDDALGARTFYANQALSRIALALSELPQLRGIIADGPIPDLLEALDDLRRGQSPSLLRSSPDQTGKLSTKLDMLKLRAVASVLAVKRTGASDTEARKLVAKVFADAGHKGKKGGPLSAATLFSWCGECEPDLNGSTHQRLLAQHLERLPSELTRAKALALVRAEASRRL